LFDLFVLNQKFLRDAFCNRHILPLIVVVLVKRKEASFNLDS